MYNQRRPTVEEKIAEIKYSLNTFEANRSLPQPREPSFNNSQSLASDYFSLEEPSVVSSYVAFGTPFKSEESLAYDMQSQLVQKEREIENLMKQNSQIMNELRSYQDKNSLLQEFESNLNVASNVRSFDNACKEIQNSSLFENSRAKAKKSYENIPEPYDSHNGQLQALKEKNLELSVKVEGLKKELRRRPSTQLVEETKDQIKRLEKKLEKRSKSSLDKNVNSKKLMQVLNVKSPDEAIKTVKKLLSENKSSSESKAFVRKVTKLAAETDISLGESPDLNQVGKSIARVYQEYKAIKKDQKVFRNIMKTLNINCPKDLLSTIYKLL